jgi:hypothetical protein
MPQFSQEFSSGRARLRIDVLGAGATGPALEDLTFLNYRLASVRLEPVVSRATPDVVWQPGAPRKDIRYDGNTLHLDGEWFQGELNKIVVSMLALRLEEVGLHPFHASAVRYQGRTIMFLGGESNHGKTMSQIEGCRRGGQVVSTETTVVDERGWAVLGSKTVFLRDRSKGTERSDLPDQDEGVAKFFDRVPEFVNYDEPSPVDLVVMPAIDGHFDTRVAEMIPFEREYQTYHSLMNYLGLNQLLSPGLPMPLIDTDERRRKRAEFVHRFAARPYYLIHARTPQLLLDEVERLRRDDGVNA